MKHITIKLTPVQIDHLLTLLADAQNDGYYYGPKGAYWARHKAIARALADSAAASGVLSPYHLHRRSPAAR
jgi:hypothetical protein